MARVRRLTTERKPETVALLTSAPPEQLDAQAELLRKIEQLRSLIRSAMSTLTSDAGTTDANANFFCDRIALLPFNEAKLPSNASPAVRELYQRLLAQLEAVRLASANKEGQSVLSDALVQLNLRAREFAGALDAIVQPANIRVAQDPGKARA